MTEFRETPGREEPEKWIWTEEAKAQIVEWLGRYTETLHLQGYEIDITFSDAACTEDSGYDDGTAARTWANHPYRTGNRMVFYPRMLKWSARQREIRVIHELVHILTDPVYGLLHKALVQEKLVLWHVAKEANEFLTDHLAAIFAELTLPK
jgi:hypothetical protein